DGADAWSTPPRLLWLRDGRDADAGASRRRRTTHDREIRRALPTTWQSPTNEKCSGPRSRGPLHFRATVSGFGRAFRLQGEITLGAETPATPIPLRRRTMLTILFRRARPTGLALAATLSTALAACADHA